MNDKLIDNELTRHAFRHIISADELYKLVDCRIISPQGFPTVKAGRLSVVVMDDKDFNSATVIDVINNAISAKPPRIPVNFYYISSEIIRGIITKNFAKYSTILVIEPEPDGGIYPYQEIISVFNPETIHKILTAHKIL